jgi:hypothetical protein
MRRTLLIVFAQRGGGGTDEEFTPISDKYSGAACGRRDFATNQQSQ